MADNVITFRCSSVIYPHLLLSPSHFQNSLSTFSIERVNGIPLWDFCASDFQRALKIIIIAELFIVMTISPGQLRHNNSDNAEKYSFTIVRPQVRSRSSDSYVTGLSDFQGRFNLSSLCEIQNNIRWSPELLRNNHGSKLQGI